jgi:hypothetical protein
MSSRSSSRENLFGDASRNRLKKVQSGSVYSNPLDKPRTAWQILTRQSVEVRRDTMPRDLEKQLQWKKSEWEEAVAKEIMDESSTYNTPAALPPFSKPYYHRFIPRPPQMPSFSMRMPRWLPRKRSGPMEISAPTLISGPMAPTPRIAVPHPLRLHSVLLDRSTQTSPGALQLPEFDFPIPPPSIRSPTVYRNAFRVSSIISPARSSFSERSIGDWPLPLFKADGRPQDGEARLADVRRKSTMVRAPRENGVGMGMQRVEISTNPFVHVDKSRLVARDEGRRLSRSTTGSRATTMTNASGQARGF